MLGVVRMARRVRRVRMTRHAVYRVEVRSDKNPVKLRHEVARRLQGMLRIGVEPDPGLGVKVPLEDGLVAVCVPSVFGGWDVVTVIKEEAVG